MPSRIPSRIRPPIHPHAGGEEPGLLDKVVGVVAKLCDDAGNARQGLGGGLRGRFEEVGGVHPNQLDRTRGWPAA